MATYKALGQQAPSATTLTSLYTPGGSVNTVVSSIAVCNRGATSTTFRLAHRLSGAAISNEMYFAYDATVAANDTKFITVGVSLNGSDILSVYAGNGNLSFIAWGVESP